MVNFDFKHPEKFYFDVIEYFNGKINTSLTTYVSGYFDDNQNEIINYLEDLEFGFNFQIFYNIQINVLMNIEYNNENKWILTNGNCETMPILFPFHLFCDLIYNINENSEPFLEFNPEKFNYIKEDILEDCKEHLFFNKNIQKICNSCNNDAIYNCKECDNLDFCEECQQTCKYEKLHMKKLNDDEKKGLCDICGKKQPDYSNNDFYYLCSDCFLDNPHKNHQLTKLEKKSNLYNDKEIIIILRKNLYYHFAVQILKRCNFSDLWKKLEKNNICQIFNCDNPIIKAYIELLNIKQKTLKELKEIELEFPELFDKMVRKYFTLQFRQFDFLFRTANNIVVFYSDDNCIKFFKDGLKLVKNKNKFLPKKENNDFKLNDNIIEL